MTTIDKTVGALLIGWFIMTAILAGGCVHNSELRTMTRLTVTHPTSVISYPRPQRDGTWEEWSQVNIRIHVPIHPDNIEVSIALTQREGGSHYVLSVIPINSSQTLFLPLPYAVREGRYDLIVILVTREGEEFRYKGIIRVV